MNDSRISTAHLNDLTRELNTAFGYTNRYRLIRRAAGEERATGRVWSIYCAKGPDDRNESGWMTRRELNAWLRGTLYMHGALTRRVGRDPAKHSGLPNVTVLPMGESRVDGYDPNHYVEVDG